MAENPYQGTEFESVWLQGFQDGLNEPNVSHQPPSDATSEQSTIYLEGEGAGRTDANAQQPITLPEITIEGDPNSGDPPIIDAPLPEELTHPETHVDPEQPGGPDLSTVAGAVATGYAAYRLYRAAQGLYKKGQTVVRVLAAVGIEVSVGELAILSIPVLVILESDPPAPTDDRSAMNQWLAARCADRGCSDLYLPLCRRSDPATVGPWQDALTAGGYWHGQLYNDDLDGAVDEAVIHLAANLGMDGDVGVLHYQAAVPDQLEFCQITIEMSDADQSINP